MTVPTFNPEEGVQEVVVFPNPAADEALVSFSLTEEQDVKLFVTDLSGKLVRNAGIRHIQADAKEQWTVPVQTLQAGTYMVMLEGESFRSVKKLVVSK
ncbi:MAG: T9SS type A sorting domain-containing protein [Saprospiraceae bacterium]